MQKGEREEKMEREGSARNRGPSIGTVSKPVPDAWRKGEKPGERESGVCAGGKVRKQCGGREGRQGAGGGRKGAG